MAFKKANDVKAEKNQGRFVLEGNGDTADVIFLYRNSDEMLEATVHFINNSEYKGYIHCLETGCPECEKGYKARTKLFVPVYVISQNGIPVNQIQFWEKSTKFEHILDQVLFRKFANPSAYVFRITRNGDFGDKETTYSIVVAGQNVTMPYDKIMSDNKAVFPDYYDHIVKEFDVATVAKWASMSNDTGSSESSIGEYVPTPRASAPAYNNSLPGGVLVAGDEAEDEITEDVDFG